MHVCMCYFCIFLVFLSVQMECDLLKERLQAITVRLHRTINGAATL